MTYEEIDKEFNRLCKQLEHQLGETYLSAEVQEFKSFLRSALTKQAEEIIGEIENIMHRQIRAIPNQPIQIRKSSFDELCAMRQSLKKELRSKHIPKE